MFNLTQIIKYLFVGGTSALLELGLFYLFLFFFNFYYLYSSIISFLIVLFYGFLMQKYFTFKNQNKNFYTQFVFFIVIVLIALIFNTFFTYLFVENFYFDYVFAKGLAIIIVFIWNFFMQKSIVFKELKYQE